MSTKAGTTVVVDASTLSNGNQKFPMTQAAETTAPSKSNEIKPTSQASDSAVLSNNNPKATTVQASEISLVLDNNQNNSTTQASENQARARPRYVSRLEWLLVTSSGIIIGILGYNLYKKVYLHHGPYHTSPALEGPSVLNAVAAILAILLFILQYVVNGQSGSAQATETSHHGKPKLYLILIKAMLVCFFIAACLWLSIQLKKTGEAIAEVDEVLSNISPNISDFNSTQLSTTPLTSISQSPTSLSLFNISAPATATLTNSLDPATTLASRRRDRKQREAMATSNIFPKREDINLANEFIIYEKLGEIINDGQESLEEKEGTWKEVLKDFKTSADEASDMEYLLIVVPILDGLNVFVYSWLIWSSYSILRITRARKKNPPGMDG